VYDPLDLDDGALLCEIPGRESNELVAAFTLAGYAAVLIGTERSLHEIVNLLRAVRTPRLGDALLEASHWDEIFEGYAGAEERSRL
jgi:hypothetical protein